MQHQEKALTQLYAGVAKSTVDSSSQILTHIKIPLSKKSEGSNYQRMEQRKALALPMLSVVAKVVIDNNLITEASIVYGPVSPGPKHAEEAEKFLCGKKAEDKNFLEAGKIASQHATFRSSPVRGSQEFRSQVFPVCITRALREASKIATGKKA
ncbi:FAD binding domain-containing protein [Desulfovibrio litoralis]|uniref:CO dehydrogenase flavoprotein C-terminal domain-containing protein n=1 Tax=Desulfovibrio litoralis DSM 11393 TaxID=1121455 RepID=A0A1M7TIZ1_9BACT|nr:hypothetical protein [Desulfovibrio litoralis]SHN70729.1 CO dehydrogenase flavoprotein C-terminal domain-containing protein [Desulfovibrio litoralis DSM 11393]